MNDLREEPACSLFDTHCHLDQPEFDADRDAAIDRAAAAGVRQMLAVGITADTSRAAVDLAARRSEVYAAVGMQPNYCGQAQPADWDCVLELVGQPRVVALGETGLDRYWDYTPWPVQQDYFDRHLRLSQQTGLPFVVHSRDCDEEILVMLREARQRGPLTGVMHSFTGVAGTAAECIELGLHISFAGMVTYKKSQTLRDVAKTIPAERILIETDSPYLSPHPLRGKRNEPAHLVHTAACLAEVRGVPLQDFCRLTTQNARRLLGIAG
jgi:TatD DNase family protein